VRIMPAARKEAKVRKVKPSTFWMALPKGSRSTGGGLGFKGEKPVGTHFVALFYMRKFAKELADKWGDCDVVKVRLEVSAAAEEGGAG